jgi:hypothetical protein
MILKKTKEGFYCKIEFVEDLVVLDQMIQKNELVGFYDYRRVDYKKLPGLNNYREEKEKVYIIMYVLQKYFEKQQYILHGQTKGSSFHNYHLSSLNTELYFYRKMNLLDYRLAKYANSLKNTTVIVIDEYEYSIFELKDYNYKVLQHKNFESNEISKEIINLVTTLEKKEYLFVTNFLIADIITSNKLKLIYEYNLYITNLPVISTLDKVNFYKSNAFKNIKLQNNMHRENKLYLDLKNKLIVEHNLNIYADCNNIKKLYVTLDKIQQLKPLLNKIRDYKIVSNNFSDLYSLPKVFAEVYYLIQ